MLQGTNAQSRVFNSRFNIQARANLNNSRATAIGIVNEASNNADMIVKDNNFYINAHLPSGGVTTYGIQNLANRNHLYQGGNTFSRNPSFSGEDIVSE